MATAFREIMNLNLALLQQSFDYETFLLRLLIILLNCAFGQDVQQRRNRWPDCSSVDNITDFKPRICRCAYKSSALGEESRPHGNTGAICIKGQYAKCTSKL